MLKKSHLFLSLLASLLLSGCMPEATTQETPNVSSESTTSSTEIASPSKIPGPNELPISADYIVINDNIPEFSDLDIANTEHYAYFSPLDELGRTGRTHAYLTTELMPASDRSDISSIYPSGWKQTNYDFIDNGGWLYNRSHLVGYQLSGDDQPENLITGTRQFNVDGMLPIENFVANYIETTNQAVIYRVTPLYEGNNLLSHGVQMEGYSPADDGKSIQFNVFVPNQQDGIEINYRDGSHKAI